MPEVTITIGGRDFQVACQEGEEHFLRSAAQMLDNEASTLLNQIGRMPEARMLLMAGLLLADKAAGTDDKLRVPSRWRPRWKSAPVRRRLFNVLARRCAKLAA